MCCYCCSRSVAGKGICEVLVVDGGSSDRTVKVAKAHGAKVSAATAAAWLFSNLATSSSAAHVVERLHAQKITLCASFGLCPLLQLVCVYCCCQVIKAPRGRGPQLNAGWRASKADWVRARLHYAACSHDGWQQLPGLSCASVQCKQSDCTWDCSRAGPVSPYNASRLWQCTAHMVAGKLHSPRALAASCAAGSACSCMQTHNCRMTSRS